MLTASAELHTAYPDYLWLPSALANASHSAEYLAIEYAKYLFSSPSDAQKTNFIQDSIEDGLGIYDYTDAEITALVKDPLTALYQYANMISKRSQSGWTTHGHSAADVNIYSSDMEATMALVGNHENTEVGDFLRDYLGVDVAAVTEELLEKGTTLMVENVNGEQVGWMGSIPDEEERLDGQDHVASLDGDVMKRHVLHGRGCDCGH